jgi:hypothetical protein
MLPEEIELNKKHALLDRLKDRLADREEEMTDLRTELEHFETLYKLEVGQLYAELDEIEALIAEEEVKLVPDDEEIKKKAEEMRRRAEESAANAAAKGADAGKWQPTTESKKAYHNLARVIHPDLALDPAEKEKRHGLMSQLNLAYSSGDQALLDKMTAELKNSHELVTGDSVGDDLVRAVRQIHQVRSRLHELSDEMAAAKVSESYILFQKISAETDEGRDPLKHMAERTRTHIKKSERRLENLRNVNTAQEEYVKEKFGMDISDFR